MAVLILPDEGLCHPDAVYAFCDISVEIALLVGLNLPCPALLALDEHDDQCQQWQSAEAEQGQSGVAYQHKYNNEEKVA